MPWIAFVDSDVYEELEKINNNSKGEDKFPEHEFLGSCLRIGLTVSDLEKLSYIDVMKVLITYIADKPKEERKATQQDIDKFLR